MGGGGCRLVPLFNLVEHALCLTPSLSRWTVVAAFVGEGEDQGSGGRGEERRSSGRLVLESCTSGASNRFHNKKPVRCTSTACRPPAKFHEHQHDYVRSTTCRTGRANLSPQPPEPPQPPPSGPPGHDRAQARALSHPVPPGLVSFALSCSLNPRQLPPTAPSLFLGWKH